MVLPFGIVGASKLWLLCSQGSSASCMAMGARNVSAVGLGIPREGLLRRSAETVRPADLFKWDVERVGDMALSLKHRDTKVTIPLSVAQNMFEGKVLQLSVRHGATSSSSDTALNHFETEAYWTTAPTVFADGEPMDLWVPIASVMAFPYPHIERKGRTCMQHFDGWLNILQHVG